jgi:hypothetical protein
MRARSVYTSTSPTSPGSQRTVGSQSYSSSSSVVDNADETQTELDVANMSTRAHSALTRRTFLSPHLASVSVWSVRTWSDTEPTVELVCGDDDRRMTGIERTMATELAPIYEHPRRPLSTIHDEEEPPDDS